MATYLTPGVYVEEDLSSGAANDASASRAIGAFVGVAPIGPSVPTLIRSWAQFVTLFGGFNGPRNYLPFAVYQFFANGGGNCYVVRAVREDATNATATLNDSTAAGSGGPKPALTVTALSAGAASNALSVVIAPTGAEGGRFDLRVVNGTTIVERFADLSSDPDDARYVISVVNSPADGSLLIRLVNPKVVDDYVYNATTDVIPAQTAALTGGEDGDSPYDYVAAAKKLADVPGSNFDLNIPAMSDTAVLNQVLAWAESIGRVFLVIDGPRAAEGATSDQVKTGYTSMVTGNGALTQSSYGAVYGPWLMCADPSSNRWGARRLLPPGGAVVGQMAKTDLSRNAAKAPAGVENIVANVLSTEARFTEAQLDELAQAQINIIRLIPGYGHCIFGARTLKLSLPDLYVPVRRTVIMLRKTLIDQTRWAVFEPNAPDTWQRIRLSLSAYLSKLRKAGVLAGQTDRESFFVNCGPDQNPQSEINAGRLNVEVGVRLLYPAEFVIIKLSHYEGTAASNEA
ncbi:phage tail sheath C-terminal domain-containing protein [Microbispora sp. NPDC049633]|uniref:phage tail sheath C-terminal domain-containing protein n=1 Tax=Microbispora sp. NPDC049633 TaxID=3154355 RepID=UPI003442219B